MANFDRERAAVTFKWVSYSSPAIIIKEELLGEWHVFKRALFHEKKFMMGEKNQPTIFARHKIHHVSKLFLNIYKTQPRGRGGN